MIHTAVICKSKESYIYNLCIYKVIIYRDIACVKWCLEGVSPGERGNSHTDCSHVERSVICSFSLKLVVYPVCVKMEGASPLLL